MKPIELRMPIIHNDFDRAGEASSKLKNILKQIGYPPSVIRRVAIAAYEAEMNVVVHASDGEMYAVITPSEVKVTIKDNGPGIADLNKAMEEGFSTAPQHIRELGFGAGMGLPNIKKNSDELKIETKVPEGTTLEFTIRSKNV